MSSPTRSRSTSTWSRRLTKRETAALDEKHARSLTTARRRGSQLPGGVRPRGSPGRPHPIYVDRGEGSKVWDIDGNEYVDYHNGYGVMVMGHAHPKIVEAVRARVAMGTHFAQPTEDALPVADQLAERTGLPYWRFGNSGTEATLDVVRIMRATTGRDLIVEDRRHVPRAPRRADGVGLPARSQAGPRELRTRCRRRRG